MNRKRATLIERAALARMFVITGVVFSVLGCATAQETYLLKAENLQRAKARLAAGDKKLQPALEQLVQEADKALKAGPFSVMDKTLMPPSGDKHDYMSIGPYWWPDPTKPDGLPYIRKDGQVNPERSGGDTDGSALGKMTSAVKTLSLAYYFTGKEVYAERAAKVLRVWFLDPATRMNPHLKYGQSIPGRAEGRAFGIIDTHIWPELVDNITLLSSSPAWTETDQQQLVAWFRDYLDWLLTSDLGKEEARQPNNHGTFYDVQVAQYALFTGQPDIARKFLDRTKQRIAEHIAPDGGQPLELARTRSFSYSLMNLDGLFDLATLGDEFQMNLWNFQTQDGRSLRRALDYLAPYADPERKWPHQQIVNAKESGLLSLLRRGALAYDEQRYEELIAKTPAANNTSRIHLTHPSKN